MGLQENLRQEPVSRLALREAITVSPETTLREANAMMREKQLGCVIIVDDQQRPVGTYTEEELIKVLAGDVSQLDEPVKDHISPRWAAVSRQDPVAKVLEAMQSQDLRFVCVTDDERKATALTGQKGLMEYVAEHFPNLVMSQRVGSKDYTPEREGA